MTSSHNDTAPCKWFWDLAWPLDCRSGTRLVWLFLGAVLARGRRTVTSWIRAAGLSSEFRPSYTTVAAVGKNTDLMAWRLADRVVKPLLSGTARLTFALDDTPTKRYGPHVEAAGIHHNPTPGPAGSAFVYGHVWVVLGLLATHPNWGMIALPLLARLYIRVKDIERLDRRNRPAFRTKLELAVDLMQWAVKWMGDWAKSVWVVADGAFANASFLKPVMAMGVTVVSRLRKDAALHTLPGPRRPGQRGRPPVYGSQRIELAKRAGQRRGWQIGTFVLYGKQTVKRYKTFLATWQPAGGVIRVVLVDEPHGWRAFFCTHATASVADILETVSDRFSLETAFRDIKEVVGGGQQQLRLRSANIGAFHLCLWTYTMTEAWAWSRPKEAVVDRTASPWDDPRRRPSHADKRRAWQQELLATEIRAVLSCTTNPQEIAAAAINLLNLAA